MPDKKIPISPETAKLLKKQLKAFRKKYHRDPGPDDPVFFDPTADSPQPMPEPVASSMLASILKAAREANIRPEILYAMKKTGRIVTAQNAQYLTPEELAEWDAAIGEFRTLN